MTRAFAALLVVVGLVIAFGGCSSSKEPATTPAPTDLSFAAKDDLDSLPWAGPKFDPDYNNLTAQPWVDPVTDAQRDTVNVFPDRLEFSKADHPDVATWSPGRVVVSGIGKGAGRNPFGFARRVKLVRDTGSLYVVDTETVGLEDVVQGDFQQTFDPNKAVEVDMSKIDADWVARNLYQDLDIVSFPGDGLPDDDNVFLDDDGNPIPGADPLFGKLWKAIKKGVSKATQAIGKAAKAIVQAAKDAWVAITPASFDGSVKLTDAMSFDYKSQLFQFELKQKLPAKKVPVEVFLKGTGDLATSMYFNPGVQVGASVPVPGHNTSFSAWANIDSRARAKFDMNVNIEAGIASADGVAGSELEKRLNEQAELAADVYGQVKDGLLGLPDTKPAGGWKKTLYLSRPAMQTFAAGPIPVIITETFQLDLECGFEAKASLQAKLSFEQNATFKYRMEYKNNRVNTIQAPTFDSRKQSDVQVLGGGEISVTCGLIPRVNVFLYDSVGLFAGVRGSLVGKASFESKCANNATNTTPQGEVTLGLFGNVGVQIGARVQAPGSSYAGKAGQVAGFDIGPFEIWNTEFPIYSKTWDVPKGLGYCLPTCKNLGKDAQETDADCGGPQCGKCAEGKACLKNSDCSRGFCVGGKCNASDHCGDRVRSGNESDVDCGGKCTTKCATGRACQTAKDCASGFCRRVQNDEDPLATFSVGTGTCVADHCKDGVRDADETGIDCGGATCGKCALGATCAVERDCVSGFSNGTFCVADGCADRRRGGLETDVDCGGATSCRRCGLGQKCNVNADCGSSASRCDSVTKTCQPSGCKDGKKNNGETDVDCGGPDCGKCADGKQCTNPLDCVNGGCDGVCYTPQP